MNAVAGKRKRPLNSLGAWAKKCRAFRLAHGITQSKAASLVGVSFGTWRAWEGGRNVPSNLAQEAIKSKFPANF